MLVALGPDGPDPVPALQQAEDTGVLLRRVGDKWMFAHVLLAQAAYHSVLRKTRETLHAQIVDFLQTRYPQRMARDPALLADHQRKARQTVPAIRSYLAASQAAMLQGSFSDAEAHAKRALGLCPDIAKDIDPVDLEIECHTALGSILMQVQGFTAEPVRAAFYAVQDIARAQQNLARPVRPRSTAVLRMRSCRATGARPMNSPTCWRVWQIPCPMTIPASKCGWPP